MNEQGYVCVGGCVCNGLSFILFPGSFKKENETREKKMLNEERKQYNKSLG